MEGAGKSILYIIIAVMAIALIAYGSFLLMSPTYRDKLNKRPMKIKKHQSPTLVNFGGFHLEAGDGMSMEESGQKFSTFRPGQNPNLKGSSNTDIKEESNPQGEADLFTMFMQ